MSLCVEWREERERERVCVCVCVVNCVLRVTRVSASVLIRCITFPLPEPFRGLSIVRSDQSAVDFARGPRGFGVDEGVDADHHDHAVFLERQMGVPRRSAQLAIHLKQDFGGH